MKQRSLTGVKRAIDSVEEPENAATAMYNQTAKERLRWEHVAGLHCTMY